jgi:hypothetical protein
MFWAPIYILLCKTKDYSLIRPSYFIFYSVFSVSARIGGGGNKNKNNGKQAGAELCQAQFKLG